VNVGVFTDASRRLANHNRAGSVLLASPLGYQND
jgi:hypothetical protein